MGVTAIRRFDRAEALEQLRLDPMLAKASLASLAKRWGVARSTVRTWLGEAQARRTVEIALSASVPAPAMPVAAPATPMTAQPRSGSVANLVAYLTAALLAAVAAYFSVSGMTGDIPGRTAGGGSCSPLPWKPRSLSPPADGCRATGARLGGASCGWC